MINLLTKDSKLIARNIERIRNIIKALPSYLQLLNEHGKDKDVFNTEMITIKALGNSYMGHVPQKSIMDAINVGRGLTSPLFHSDETAFFTNIEYSLPAALAAGGYARQLAAERGEPYGTVFTTTAGRRDDPAGRYTYNLFMDSMVWTEKLFDVADEEELMEVVKKHTGTKIKRVYCFFNHRQLGYSDQWLMERIRETGATGDAARMDFFGEWVTGTLSNPIPTKLLEKIRDSLNPDPNTQITSSGYIIGWHLSQQQIDGLRLRDGLILGVDTSDAVGRDDIALCLRDAYSGAVLACGNYNETNLIQFAEWLLWWLTTILNWS
jgi:hypothetical protein